MECRITFADPGIGGRAAKERTVVFALKVAQRSYECVVCRRQITPGERYWRDANGLYAMHAAHVSDGTATAEGGYAERDTILRADLARARDAVKAANACLSHDSEYRYAVALVRLDAELPLGIVEVDASSLYPGAVLPTEPERQDPPCVPPEERGGALPVMIARLRAEELASEGRRLRAEGAEVPVAEVDEIGEHRFPADSRAPAICIDCGCTLEAAQTRRRCGA